MLLLGCRSTATVAMLAVQSATRDGARWAATPNFTIDTAPDQAVAHVRESLSLLGLSCTEAEQSSGMCTIEAEPEELEGLIALTVRTTIDHRTVFGGVLPIPDNLHAMTSFVLIDQTPADDGAP